MNLEPIIQSEVNQKKNINNLRYVDDTTLMAKMKN